MSNVCARREDREAVFRHIDFDMNQIHVHYVGCRDDKDECEPQRVQLPPMLEKTMSQLEHAKAKEVQPLRVVCHLSSTAAVVLLASTRELLQGTAMAGLLSSRLRRGPPRKKRATSSQRMHIARRWYDELDVSIHLSREQCHQYICMQDTCASTPS